MSDRQEVRATVGQNHAGVRVDRFVADEMELFSRSQLRHHGVAITVNGKIAKP